MRFFKALTTILLYIMSVFVNQCDNKSSVIVYSKYGSRGYEKLEYSIDKQGLREGNYV